MNRTVLIIISVFTCLFLYSQSKKEVKKHKIKSSYSTSTENGKTIFESKKTFDSKGQTIEETNYTKDGGVKELHKTKYNSEGDEIEDEQYDANNKLTEKKIIDNAYYNQATRNALNPKKKKGAK